MPMSKNKKILMMLAKGGADAGDKPALAVAVALVAVGAGILCLGVHVLVDEGLGQRSEQLPHVDHAIVESGHLGRIGARNWQSIHCGHRLTVNHLLRNKRF